MKKVIFVGGTSYSGSTFFDMMLANDPKGFSCGEVHALFNPFRPHHINPRCGCENEYCNVWQQALINGEKNLYNTIFDLFPQVEFIVDSSKSPYWIRSQIENIKKRNLGYKNILIWKTPLELAHSFKKRTKIGWDKEWINYHRLYFTRIGNWKAVKYSELAGNIQVLKQVCNYLEIPYYQGKEKYWLKTHHTLFGNHSAKIHLYPKNSKRYKRLIESPECTLEDDIQNNNKIHRKIYYKNVENNSLNKVAHITTQYRRHSDEVLDLIAKNDVSKRSDAVTMQYKSKLPWIVFETKRVKNLLENIFMKYKYSNRRHRKNI